MELWNGLNIRRRIVIVAATLGMFGAVFGLARMAASPNLTLLYSGLEGGAAGDVVRALEQRGVAFEVRGGSIFVEAPQRDELRMTLASDGLPRMGAQGYELLDSLTGFGTTAQMFDAAYWRAKEGELARTIAASPQVLSARVHVARASDAPFRRATAPTASVFVVPATGTLTATNAKALRYLVAAAVSGLKPEDVAIMDSSGALVGAAEDEARASTLDERADALRQKVQRLLEARVGAGNAIVEVAVESETETETIRERRFDPQGRVAISTETEERATTSRNANSGGDVTVASNLPDGDAGASGGDSSSQNSETRERVNYEVTEVQREVQRAAGAIRRLTVAVLVNGISASDGGGDQTAPRPEDELEGLRDLIASAVGYDEARGDVITIKSMAFEPISPLGTEAAPGFLDRLALDVTKILQMAVLGLVALLLGLFVVRPVLSAGAAAPEPLALPPGDGAPPALDGEIDTGDFALPDLPGLPMASGFGDDFGQGGGDSPVDRLRAAIGERREDSVEILRSWLDESEEVAQ